CQWCQPGDHLAGLRMRLLDREIAAMQLAGDVEPTAQKFENGVLFDVGRLVLVTEHLEAGENKERAEEEKNPVELVHKGCAQPDQDCSEGDDAENTPEQHAVLVKPRNAEKTKDRGDDKHIVHREALLDQVTGIKLQPGFRSALPPHPATEAQCDQ